MENINILINDTKNNNNIDDNQNYILYDNKRINFTDIQNIKIIYNNKTISFENKVFDLANEYNNIKNILKTQKICPNNMKKCGGCINELLYICSPYYTRNEDQKIDLIKYVLSVNIQMGGRCCKRKNALVYCIHSRSLKIAEYLLSLVDDPIVLKNMHNPVILELKTPIAILMSAIIKEKYVLHTNAYSFVELLLKNKADPNTVFKKSGCADLFFNILLSWNSNMTNINGLKILYNDLSQTQLHSMRTKILELFKLLLKYGFNMSRYGDVIQHIFYISTKIIKYRKIDVIMCDTIKLITKNIDINDYTKNYQFDVLFAKSLITQDLHNDDNIYYKLKLLFECGLSVLKFNEHHINVVTAYGQPPMIANSIVTICEDVNGPTRLLELFFDYCDDEKYLADIKNRLQPENRFNLFIEKKYAVMKFIETHTGLHLNRGIIRNFDMVYLLLLVRKVINNNNLKTILLYKIIPFTFF